MASQSYDEEESVRLQGGHNGGSSMMAYFAMAGLALFVFNSVDINIDLLA